MNEHEILKLEIPNSSKYLSFIRNSIDGLRSNIRMPSNRFDDLKIAVNEACTNAVMYADPADSLIKILFEIKPYSMEIEIRNYGELDRQKVSDLLPPASNFLENRYGLYLIDQLTDEFQITTDSSEVVVKMVMKTGT